MSWPLVQPDLADEAAWRALVLAVLPVEHDLGYAEGRSAVWIGERVTVPEISLEWLLGRMVADGELTALPQGARIYYRKTGVVGTPTLEFPGADTAAPGDQIVVGPGGDLELVTPVPVDLSPYDAHLADMANPHATTAAQVGADALGSAAAAYAAAAGDLATHVGDPDPHPGYATDADVATKEDAGVAAAADAAHVAAADPHPQYAADTDLLAYAPLGHAHAQADVTGLVAALAGKEATGVAAAADAAHVAAGDPHGQYALESTLGTAAARNVGVGASDLVDVTTLVATFAGIGHTHAGVYSPVGHTHAAGDITSGTMAVARLPSATTSAQGIVELATDGENAANVVVQGNDSRVTKATRTLAQTLDSAAVNTTTAEITLCDLTVPANAMGTTGGVELVLHGYIKNNSGGNVSVTPRVYWGGTVVWGDALGSLVTATNDRPLDIRVRVQNLSATNKQSVRGVLHLEGGTGGGGIAGRGDFGGAGINNAFSHAAAPTKDTTSAQNVKVTVQFGTSSAQIEAKLDVAVLTLIPGA